MCSMSIAVTLVLVALGAQGLPPGGLPPGGLPPGGLPPGGLPPVGLPIVSRPPCDSPDIEAVAMVAQDYLNGQHTHGYKYVLNRIEDVKIITTLSGEATYLMEVDLLETSCHVLDPKPLTNCSVRPKVMTAVEGDCDVVLKQVGGALSVTAFKCKTEESREDMCPDCPTLLPLNDTIGLDFVQASLGTFNVRTNQTFSLMEVGRMSKKPISAGDIIAAEYVIIGANCTSSECVPLDNAEQGFCVAEGLGSDYTVDCTMFGVLSINDSSTAASSPSLLPVIQPGLRHHKLTLIHNPGLSGLLSAESAGESGESTESGEVVQVVLGSPTSVAADPPLSTLVPVNAVLDPVMELLPTLPVNLTVEDKDIADVVPTVGSIPTAGLPAGDDSTKAVVVKRAAESVKPVMLDVTELTLPVPQCPGRIRHY
ncbi:alpha-2-HS-glycoprotein-like isoform X2 [Gadus macrocephalus]|uniref:alpha-2-HS-glycoprotein-like isoform X2 n=1 Tax=Gadus macrocephalus TaxID=80720 RepID=UPI0028CB72F1|nr:alpha-2-HS-glycoprotein-like isoform X2 [Gadus macrocephalus]